MKKTIVITMAILSINSASFAGPKVAIPENHWDFGNVPQNSTISHAYWVKNIGDDTLKIINVKPG